MDAAAWLAEWKADFKTAMDKYRGKVIEVTVLPKGFEWEGKVYRSLTSVAEAVTGSHWNGYLFFGLKDQGAK